MIAALISWFDEPAGWLYELVESVTPFCGHVVAVDGAYGLYPKATGRSPAGQAEALRTAAWEAGVGLTLHEPGVPYFGNEIQKRDLMFRLAQVTDPDWMLILDADERVIEAPADLHDFLAMTSIPTFDVEQVLAPSGRRGHTRKLFRPPLRVGRSHAEYLDARGLDVMAREAPILEGMLVEHRKYQRPSDRQQAAVDYYERRDEAGIEVRK